MDYLLKLKAWFEVSRPPLALMGFLGPLAVASQLGRLFEIKTTVLTLVIGLTNLGSLYLNEVSDIETDRIGKPHKPLPSGRLTPKSVSYVSIVFISSGASLLAIYQVYFPDGLLLALGLIALSFSLIYNLRGKTLGALGLPSMVIPIILAPAVMFQSHGKLQEGLNFVLGLGLMWYAHGLATQLQDVAADEAAKLKTDAILMSKTSWLLVLTTSALSAFFIINSSLTMLARISMLASASSVLITSPFLFHSSNKTVARVVEVLCRRMARLFLLISFLCMVLVI